MLIFSCFSNIYCAKIKILLRLPLLCLSHFSRLYTVRISGLKMWKTNYHKALKQSSLTVENMAQDDKMLRDIGKGMNFCNSTSGKRSRRGISVHKRAQVVNRLGYMLVNAV